MTDASARSGLHFRQTHDAVDIRLLYHPMKLSDCVYEQQVINEHHFE